MWYLQWGAAKAAGFAPCPEMHVLREPGKSSVAYCDPASKATWGHLHALEGGENGWQWLGFCGEEREARGGETAGGGSGRSHEYAVGVAGLGKTQSQEGQADGAREVSGALGYRSRLARGGGTDRRRTRGAVSDLRVSQVAGDEEVNVPLVEVLGAGEAGDWGGAGEDLLRVESRTAAVGRSTGRSLGGWTLVLGDGRRKTLAKPTF